MAQVTRHENQDTDQAVSDRVTEQRASRVGMKRKKHTLPAWRPAPGWDKGQAAGRGEQHREAARALLEDDRGSS